MATLNDSEMIVAATHAIARHVGAKGGDRHDESEMGEFTWEREIQAACAELAYCKAANCYWSGAAGVRSVDASDGSEIRWTEHEHIGGLFVRPGNRGRVVLVVGKAPSFRIVGWYDAQEARQHPEWRIDSRNDHRGATYKVPREFLHPFKEAEQ